MPKKDEIHYNPFDGNDTSDAAARIVHVIDKAPTLLSPENVQELEAGLRKAENLVALVRLPTNTLPN